MESTSNSLVEVPFKLIEAIRAFPVQREVEHCGSKQLVSPFDPYYECPQCKARVKLRQMSTLFEVEDVFDAVIEWMSQSGAEEAVRARQQALAADREE